MCVKLRPHHGMCLAYFSGHGYDDAFSRNMQAVLESLRPDKAIRLTLGADMICAACPHLVRGCCATPEKVLAYDRAVLDLCGLQPDQTLAFGAFCRLVQTRILSAGLRETVCGGCQWNELCRANSPSPREGVPGVAGATPTARRGGACADEGG